MKVAERTKEFVKTATDWMEARSIDACKYTFTCTIKPPQPGSGCFSSWIEVIGTHGKNKHRISFGMEAWEDVRDFQIYGPDFSSD